MAADVARDSDEVTDDESSSSSDEDDEDPAGTRRVARQKMASAKKVVARRAARLRKEEFEKEKSSCRLLAVCRGDSAAALSVRGFRRGSTYGPTRRGLCTPRYWLVPPGHAPRREVPS